MNSLRERKLARTNLAVGIQLNRDDENDEHKDAEIAVIEFAVKEFDQRILEEGR